MGDVKRGSGSLKYSTRLSTQNKYLLFTLFVLVLLILFSGGFGLVDFFKENLSQMKEEACGDGTPYNSCSSTKPYFCLDGELMDLAYICGCPDGFAKKDNVCTSSYQTDPKEISLMYTLRGESYSMNFLVYEGVADLISKIPRSIYYSDGNQYSRGDFNLKAVSDEEQRKFLLPLVIQIQDITNDKEDQARIAISIVQNIPFGVSNRTLTFGGTKVNYTRYPYEVLYDMEGVCGERTDLLAFLLGELGYGTASFYYPSYNHEALGIKCPVEESLEGSGYCFVETTGPSIITDNKISYVGVGKLYGSPEIYPIYEGDSLGEGIYEYSDADKLIRIRKSIEKRGRVNIFMHNTYEKLNEKYGLINEYYSG